MFLFISKPCTLKRVLGFGLQPAHRAAGMIYPKPYSIYLRESIGLHKQNPHGILRLHLPDKNGSMNWIQIMNPKPPNPQVVRFALGGGYRDKRGARKELHGYPSMGQGVKLGILRNMCCSP